MARSTGRPASRSRRKKILKQAKGFRGGQSKQIRQATERVARALQYAYRDRRVKKRSIRSLWITRIGSACKINGTSYSKFIDGLKKAQIEIDRKNLADIAVRNPDLFKQLVEKTVQS